MARATHSHTSDRGAVAVIVALLMVALLGLGALVIDVGALYQERSEVQNGADAAAFALAFDCAVLDTTTACTDNPTTQNQAEFFADENSADGAADVLDITFHSTAGGVKESVTVSVGTRDDSDGDDEIEFALAPVVGAGSASVSESATASWGTPIDLPMAPFGIGLCEWEDITDDGNDFGLDVTLFLRIPLSLPLLCPGGPGGGFGYLGTSDDCVADIANGFVQGQILLSDPLDALDCDPLDLVEGHMYVPIFDDVDGATPDPPCDDLLASCYQIHGYAVFEVDPDGLVDIDIDITGLLVLPSGGLEGALPSISGRFVEYLELDYRGEVDADVPYLGLSTVGLSD